MIIIDDMEGETDDKGYVVDGGDHRQPAGEVDEVEVEGHLEGEARNNLRRRTLGNIENWIIQVWWRKEELQNVTDR